MDDVIVARAVHVLSIVHWIGGLAFVTLVVLPLSLRVPAGSGRLALFETIEHRFSRQVRWSVPLAGASGLYMAERLGAGPRFLDPSQWWLHAMVILWAAFMVVLFVIEPAFGHRFLEAGRSNPDVVLCRLLAVHRILLTVSALVTAAAVAGVHGMAF